jgi:hypothetical protein
VHRGTVRVLAAFAGAAAAPPAAALPAVPYGLPNIGVNQTFAQCMITGIVIPNNELKSMYDRQIGSNRSDIYRMTSYTIRVTVPPRILSSEPPRVLILKRGILPSFFFNANGNNRTIVELVREYPELFETVSAGESKVVTVTVNNQTWRKAMETGHFDPTLIPNAPAPTLAQHMEYIWSNQDWAWNNVNGNIRVDPTHGNAWSLYPHMFLDTSSSTNQSLTGSVQNLLQDTDIHVVDVQLVNATFAMMDL